MVDSKRHNIAAAIFAISLVMLGTWRLPVTSNMRFYFQLAFKWCVIVAFAGFVVFRFNVWVGAFLALAFWSVQYPFVTDFSKAAFYYVLFGVVWYCMGVELFKNDKWASWAMDAMCIIGIGSAVLLVLQALDISIFKPAIKNIFNWDGKAPRVGLMDSPNSVSALLAFCFAAYLRFDRQRIFGASILWVWFVPLVLLGLILAKTVAGLLSVVSACVLFVFVCVKHRRFWVRSAIIVTAAVCMLSYFELVDRPDPGVRLRAWKIAVDKTRQHWVSGSGIGHWKILFARSDFMNAMGDRFVDSNSRKTPRGDLLTAQNHYMKYAHNEFVQGGFEMGGGFLVLVAGFYLHTGYRVWRLSANIMPWFLVLSLMALVIMTVDSNVFFPFHIAPIALVGVTWLSMLEARIKVEEKHGLF